MFLNLLQVVLSEHDVTASDGERVRKIEGWIIHPKYDYDTDDNDFALIELEVLLKYSGNS